MFNRHRALSPDVRRDLLASRYLRGVAEADLWDVVEGTPARRDRVFGGWRIGVRRDGKRKVNVYGLVATEPPGGRAPA